MINYKRAVHDFISKTRYITYNYKDIEIFQKYLNNSSHYIRTNNLIYFGFIIFKFKKK